VSGRCGSLRTGGESDGQTANGSRQNPHQCQDKSAFDQRRFSTVQHCFLLIQLQEERYQSTLTGLLKANCPRGLESGKISVSAQGL
jgi:hypothetical protein